MRDVGIVALIYTILFVILTTPIVHPMMGLSVQSLQGVHYFVSELVFWAGALFILGTASYGAFMRLNRFRLSRDHPTLNWVLNILLIASPFLAAFINVRFTFVLLGLLIFSHTRSKLLEEEGVDFIRSRALSNIVLLPLFAIALMLMANNGYHVSSIFDWGSLRSPDIVMGESVDAG